VSTLAALSSIFLENLIDTTREETHMAKRKRATKFGYGPNPSPAIAVLSLGLGGFILGQTPYPSPNYPKPRKSGKPFRVQTFGPGMKYDTDRPYESPDVRLKNATFKGNLLTKAKKNDILRKGLFWKVGGATRRMSKAIRIPYTYFDPKNKKMTQTALIIGYEGAGGGC
jgi:hypothetical protein